MVGSRGLRLGALSGALLFVAACGRPTVNDALDAYQRGDYAAAASQLRPLAEEGDAAAEVALGSMYNNGQGAPRDYDAAVKWYRLAAEQRNADAEAALGAMYDSGRGVKQDDGEAVKWYRLAARHGDMVAQYNLGVMYKNGRGVPPDARRAYLWFDIAAAKGEAEAGQKRDEAAARLRADDLARMQAMAATCEQSAYSACE